MLEKEKRDAKTEFETKGLDKHLVDVTKVINVIRKKRLAWHTRLTMEVTQLCERRAVEIHDQAQAEK